MENSKLSNYDKRFALAVLIILGCFGYVFVITLVATAKPNDMILGVLMTTGFGTIISFFYGSSDKKGKGAEDK